MTSLYRKDDRKRYQDENGYRATQGYRTEFRRDLDRLIHSTSFRRLQGKTQLYPGVESDFFRNRLTHSMEVAQIARSIAAKLNHEQAQLKGKDNSIDLDIVEFAGLAHDLGHPPFGHQGEEMLDILMLEDGGYEGNAQTLRILTQLEKKGLEKPGIRKLMYSSKIQGLNLTARTLASILKYDVQIQPVRSIETYSRPDKAYYAFDGELVEWIKKCVVGKDYKKVKEFKTIECQIMDLADDIAYSTYDLEDGLKAGFYSILDIIYAPDSLREKIARKIHGKNFKSDDVNRIGTVLQDMFYPFIEPGPEIKAVIGPHLKPKAKNITPNIKQISLLATNNQYELAQQYSKDGYARSFLTSSLVDTFINGVEFDFNAEHPALSKVFFNHPTFTKVEVLKKFTFMSQIESVKMKVSEIRGKEIVATIFDYIQANDGSLLPEDFKVKYDHFHQSGDIVSQNRVICDFVAGMTDRYAIEFYGRLKSENPETIFKPI